MRDQSALDELRTKELTTLRERVARRVKIKPLAKRVRRIAGVDVVLTPQASKVHVCACLMSHPKLEVLEEAIATDEMNPRVYKDLGSVVLVPLILSVLKMLKRNVDAIVVRELSLVEPIPLATYVGVIAGKPAFGVSERSSKLAKIAKIDGETRAGTVKLRGRKGAVSVIAGNLMSLKDASALVRSTAKESRLPEPLRNAAARVRAWEREWRKVNLRGR